METYKDLTGLVFNNWTIVELSNRTNKKDDRYWKCRCNCEYGTIKHIAERALYFGTSRSCGCLLGKSPPKKIIKIKHDKILKPHKDKIVKPKIEKHLKLPKKRVYKVRASNHKIIKTLKNKRIMRIYAGMKQRCYNPNLKSYKYYGGKGVVICDEWLNDKTKFYEWALNNGYSDELTIDRIENDGNYEPNNCRWATWEEQANNKSNTVYYRYEGEIKSSLDWCKETWLSFEDLKIIFDIHIIH